MAINFKNITILALIISNGIFIYLFYQQDSEVKKTFNETPEEEFDDLNGNGRWDLGEEFNDLNGNGQWDAAKREYIEEIYIEYIRYILTISINIYDIE